MLGQELKRLRKSKRIMAKEISHHVGVSRAYYSKVEGGRIPTPELLAKIASFLDVPMEYIESFLLASLYDKWRNNGKRRE